MANVHILTDSMCHIPSALAHELEIEVVPLPLVWDGRSYLDDEIEPRAFYSMLRTAKTLPKTSGPTPGSFKERFDRLGADGEAVLAILVGKQFSSTQNAANVAKDLCPGVNVTIFDSDSNTMGLGFQVLAAARAAKQGKELPELLSMLTRLRSTSGAVFVAPNVEYLRRGGRISHLQQLMARALNLVPVMELRGGPLRLVERLRNPKTITQRLLALVSERLKGGRPARLAVVHVDAQAMAWDLAMEARASLRPDELIVSELSPVLAIHAGPDALGLAYSTGA